MLRVLTVTNMWPRPDRPSYGAFVRSQVESLRALGLELDVHIIEGDRQRLAYLTAVQAVRQKVAALRPDVVHAHYGLSGWAASWQPAPLVVSFCGDDLLGTPDGRGGRTWKGRMSVALSRWAARRADAIVCKSPNLIASLDRDVDRRRAVLLPNGVDLGQFTPGDRMASRRRLGLTEGRRLVFFPHDRGQAARKRFDLAEAAVSLLRREVPEAELWHVHDVQHSEMVQYYRAADCLLLTSEFEGSPNVVKEALATQLPVISVDVGDVRHWLDRVNGCAVVERDPGAMARALAHVLRRVPHVDPSPILQELDGTTIARRLLDVYHLAGRRRRAGAG